MRNTAMMVAIFSLVFPCPEVGSQTARSALSNQGGTIADPKIINLPLPRPDQSRPKLSLQSALKIASGYIKKERIDISPYWLYRADYTLYGDKATDDKDKIPCWYFWWVNDSGSMGDYVEIFVSMDGKAWRIPSM
jgi:hypothetical protein